MKIHRYAEETLRDMQQRDENDEPTKSVMVVHYPEHVRQTMPDACPGETAEEVFEELGWELAMQDLAVYGSGR